MATIGADRDTDDSPMPRGIALISLLHLGFGALGVLGGIVLFVFSPLMAIFTAFFGLILLALGYGLMNLRAREWRMAIAFHAIDTLIGVILVLGNGIIQISGPIVSISIILYLYSQRNLFLDDTT